MTRQAMFRRVWGFSTLAIGVAALLAQAFPAVGQLFVGLAFLTSFIFAMSVGGAAHARGATRLGDAHRRPE